MKITVKNKKESIDSFLFFNGGASGTRTLDKPVMSRVL